MGDITILIVDDHPMVREGLEAMLMSEDGFKVIALAKDGEEGVKLALSERPQVILSDIRMPKADGFSLLQKLKEFNSSSRILFLAGMPLKEEEYRAKRDGAKGYLPKDVDLDILSSAIRKIAEDGEVFISEEFHAAPSILTAREMEVLKLVSQGNQRDQIATALGIGPESVKTHLKRIMTKLESTNATAAVSRAYEIGILRA